MSETNKELNLAFLETTVTLRALIDGLFINSNREIETLIEMSEEESPIPKAIRMVILAAQIKASMQNVASKLVEIETIMTGKESELSEEVLQTFESFIMNGILIEKAKSVLKNAGYEVEVESSRKSNPMSATSLPAQVSQSKLVH